MYTYVCIYKSRGDIDHADRYICIHESTRGIDHIHRYVYICMYI